MKKWIFNNLNERFENRNVDFKSWMTPTKFSIMPFHTAADYTVNEISKLNKKLFIALSGGVDSEYALLSFHRNKIPITPIIIELSSNKLEISYAYYMCKKLKIEPHIIKISDDEYIDLYMYYFKKINARITFSIVTYVASCFAKKMNGILITGNELVDYNFDSVWRVMCAEWDYYHDILLPDNIHIDFFTCTPEITYSLIYE